MSTKKKSGFLLHVQLKKWVNDGKFSRDFNFGIPSTLDVETILVVTLGPLVGKEEFEAQSRRKVLESEGGGGN